MLLQYVLILEQLPGRLQRSSPELACLHASRAWPAGHAVRPKIKLLWPIASTYELCSVEHALIPGDSGQVPKAGMGVAHKASIAVPV